MTSGVSAVPPVVVVFGFRPQYRAQAHETFKPFFNSLY